MVDHIQAGLDGKAGRFVLLVGIALDKLSHHTHGIGRRALQTPTAHHATINTAENVSPVPGKYTGISSNGISKYSPAT